MGQERPVRVSRRGLVRGVLAAGAAAAGAEALAAQGPPAGQTTGADIAAASRLYGHDYSDEQSEEIVPSVREHYRLIRAIRAVAWDAPEGPALLFDPCVPGTPVPKGKPAFHLSRGRAPACGGDPERLAFATAAELSRLLRARKVSSVELTRMYLDRLQRIGPKLACVVTLTAERAMAQAERADRELAAGTYRGPLHGIPYGIKDLFATRGIRTTWGARPYENQVFDYDATVVRRLEEAGAVLVAKLTTGELALGDFWFGGVTRNPWRPTRGSWGSSAGSASATAAGLVGFSIGTETLGSIVSPCLRTGATGHRPTYGRVSRHGVMALAWSMDKVGPICRGVEDCAMVLNAIYGPDPLDPSAVAVPFRWNPGASLRRLRVGIDRAAFDTVRKDERRWKLYEAVLETLERLGIRLIPVTLPPPELYTGIGSIILGAESAAAFAGLMASGQLSLLANQRAWPRRLRGASTIPAADYLQAQRVRTRLQHDFARALEDVDLYVTVPGTGPSMAFTNLTGHPTVVTRCGMLDGLPQMVEFIGGLYREDAILRVAHAYEQATPHRRLWPDTEALPPLPSLER